MRSDHEVDRVEAFTAAKATSEIDPGKGSRGVGQHALRTPEVAGPLDGEAEVFNDAHDVDVVAKRL